MLADEADVFEALVASERVAEWVEQACGGSSRAARAAAELAAACVDSVAYAEEAAAVGAAGALRAAAEATHDAALGAALRAAADALDAAAARRADAEAAEESFALPGGGAVRLRQSSRVADGLGGRVWGAAPLLVALLGADAELRAALHGASVLELGAGAGLAGLAARRLGAARVALTDAGAPQLALLRQNAALNSEAAAAPDAGAAHAELDGVRVRHLDWDAPDAACCGSDGTPPLPPDERFGVVLAADVLYELGHAAGVARALAARLARDAASRALLVCPVRCAATADAFQARAAQEGLACARLRLPDGAGAERYEGGYARFDLRWAPERLQEI